MYLELRKLRRLLALAEHGSSGRAATALRMTQPAPSRRSRSPASPGNWRGLLVPLATESWGSHGYGLVTLKDRPPSHAAQAPRDRIRKAGATLQVEERAPAARYRVDGLLNRAQQASRLRRGRSLASAPLHSARAALPLRMA